MLIGAAIIVVVALVFTTNEKARDFVVSKITGNPQVTFSTKDGFGGVKEIPEELVQAAATVLGYVPSLDVYTAARLIASEASWRESDTSKKYRAHVGFNLATAARQSITSLSSKRDGSYGKQIGRAFSTYNDPGANDVALAEEVMSERNQGIDLTGGALQFSDRGGFGVQDGTSSWEEHVIKRKSEGKTGANLPGAPTSLVFWYRGFLPSNATKANI